MNPWEALAALCGLANMALLARRSVWNFPFGMAMVLIFAGLFLASRLYAVAALQLFFFAAQAHGLWAWRRAGADAGATAIRSLPRRRWLPALLAGLALSALLGLGLARTDAAAPWVDGPVAAWSVVAQLLTNGRYVESWPLWVGINIASVALYAGQALWITAGLYGVFLALALWSWRAWGKAAT
ncbi:MAG: nicotinamide riboside transporter PnuC [Sphingomonadales bacterium]|jgi:nicotinamide mononucleotide transporter